MCLYNVVTRQDNRKLRKVFFLLASIFLASNCTCAVYFTYTAHVPLLAKNMTATHVHAFARAFAYAIKQIPYAFVAKIILCICICSMSTERNFSDLNSAFYEVLVPVTIFQFPDMRNENRFLDTF